MLSTNSPSLKHVTAFSPLLQHDFDTQKSTTFALIQRNINNSSKTSKTGTFLSFSI